MEEEKYIVALEIGSSKIKGAIGTLQPGGTLTVKAVEEEKLVDEVRYGCIRNIAEVSRTVRNILDRLESREAPRRIEGVYVSVGGRSVASSIIGIERHLSTEMEITTEMINDIFTEALSQPLHERTVIDVTPREFRINGSPASRPVGTYGSSILANLNLVSCRSQLINNIKLVLESRLQLKIRDIFVRQLIEGDLVLYNDEKRLGCALVDFGAETTTVSVYKNGVLQYLATLPMGSRNITLDITALNHLEERAEELKITGGNAMPSADQGLRHGMTPDFSEINSYISARAGEIIANIIEQIHIAGFSPEQLPGGIILIGNGAKLNGFMRRIENMSKMKVRVGLPGSQIRIADPGIRPGDAVDVIALLAAAQRNAQECMTVKRPEFVDHNGPAPIFVDEPATVIPDSYHRPQQPEQPYQQPARRPSAPDFPYEPVKPENGSTRQEPEPQEPETKHETQTPVSEPAPEPKPKSGWGRMLDSLRDRFVDLISEPEEND